CNQNDSSTHEYKIDHQQLKNHIKQLEEWALLEKFYDNNAYYSKRTKQLEKKITDAGFITGKVNAEKFNVKEFKDDITSMLCEQPPLRTHQISSSGYVSADKLPKLYELNLKDAQRDLKTTPVDIDGVSLKFKTRERIAEEIAKKTAEKTAKKNSEIIAKQNANSIEEKNIEKNNKETNPEDNFV
ncbi:TPA: hypothetical protein N6480_005217, partial [Escherichia coli]|nr:hypothetical protein [Escherichia coli]